MRRIDDHGDTRVGEVPVAHRGTPGKQTATQRLARGPAAGPRGKDPFFTITPARVQEWMDHGTRHIHLVETMVSGTLAEYVALGFVFIGQWRRTRNYVHPNGTRFEWDLATSPDEALERVRADAERAQQEQHLLAVLELERVGLRSTRAVAPLPYERALAEEQATGARTEAWIVDALARAEAARPRVRHDSRDELERLISELQTSLAMVRVHLDAARAADAEEDPHADEPSPPAPTDGGGEDGGWTALPTDLPALPTDLPALPTPEGPGLPDLGPTPPEGARDGLDDAFAW